MKCNWDGKSPYDLAIQTDGGKNCGAWTEPSASNFLAAVSTSVESKPRHFVFKLPNGQKTYEAFERHSAAGPHLEIRDQAGEIVGSVANIEVDGRPHIEIRYASGGVLMSGPIKTFPASRCELRDSNGPRVELKYTFWNKVMRYFDVEGLLQIVSHYRHGETEQHLIFAAAMVFRQRHLSNI